MVAQGRILLTTCGGLDGPVTIVTEVADLVDFFFFGLGWDWIQAALVDLLGYLQRERSKFRFHILFNNLNYIRQDQFYDGMDSNPGTQIQGPTQVNTMETDILRSCLIKTTKVIMRACQFYVKKVIQRSYHINVTKVM